MSISIFQTEVRRWELGQVRLYPYNVCNFSSCFLYSFSSSSFVSSSPHYVLPYYVNDSNLTYTSLLYNRVQVLYTVPHYCTQFYKMSITVLFEEELRSVKKEKKKGSLFSSVSLVSGTNLYLVFRTM